MRRAWVASWLLISCYLFALPSSTSAGQADHLRQLVRRRGTLVDASYDVKVPKTFAAHSHVVLQDGQMEDDRISELPGQKGSVDFDHYAGYVTVDSTRGRALFYYFVESPQDASVKPLVLWLNGGPGCSSFGYGAMEELGPFRVNSDGKTLFRNEYAWNKVANVLFLESPAGVGFSYSNSSSDYDNTGDRRTAADAYIFLINWLERFPQYKNRDFYITGESFAGHYVPELAYTIISNGPSPINLKGIAIGNAYLDGVFGSKVDANTKGVYDYYWSHALISDESHAAFISQCHYPFGNVTGSCLSAMLAAEWEVGRIDTYSIYAPLCHRTQKGKRSTGSIADFDPCTDNYVRAYLNLDEVKKALHATVALPYSWNHCRSFNWKDMPDSMLPTIQKLIGSGTRIWLYRQAHNLNQAEGYPEFIELRLPKRSGDNDAVVPVTSTRNSINLLDLPVETPWRPWIHEGEVGGYVVGYKGLTLATVRGAGHEVPSYQPGRSLTMIAAFLQGKLPPDA